MGERLGAMLPSGGEILEELKGRGLEEVDLSVTDGLRGRREESAELAQDLRKEYKASSRTEGEGALKVDEGGA